MKNNQEILDVFLHKKPVGIVLSLKDSKGKYASVLSKEVDCTYTHTLKILSHLEEKGMVEFNKEGRIKGVILTPLGEDIAHNLDGLVRQLKRLSEEQPKNEEVEKGGDE